MKFSYLVHMPKLMIIWYIFFLTTLVQVALSGPSVTDRCCSILLFSVQCSLAPGRSPLCYGALEGGWWSEDHHGSWAGPSPKALGGFVWRPEPRTRWKIRRRSPEERRDATW